MALLIRALKKCSRCHHHLTPLFGATRSGHTYLPLTTKQNKVTRAEIWSEWEWKEGKKCSQLHSSCKWSLLFTRVWCHALCPMLWGYRDVPQPLSGAVLKACQGFFLMGFRSRLRRCRHPDSLQGWFWGGDELLYNNSNETKAKKFNLGIIRETIWLSTVWGLLQILSLSYFSHLFLNWWVLLWYESPVKEGRVSSQSGGRPSMERNISTIMTRKVFHNWSWKSLQLILA